MSFSPQSPKLVQGGLVTLDPGSGALIRVIPLQYNPASVSRSLQAQWYEPQAGGDLAERLRVKGPPVETLNVKAEIDATDALEFPDQNESVVEYGIHPHLAALETLVYPTSRQLEFNNSLAAAGTLEIVPMEAPLTVFVFSRSRVTPVRITEFSVEEEFFDTELNPLRATVSLGMRVLNVADLGFQHRGGTLFMQYLKQKERLATLAPKGDLSTLGLGGLS